MVALPAAKPDRGDTYPLRSPADPPGSTPEIERVFACPRKGSYRAVYSSMVGLVSRYIFSRAAAWQTSAWAPSSVAHAAMAFRSSNSASFSMAPSLQTALVGGLPRGAAL